MMIHHKTKTLLYPICIKQTLGHLSLWIVSNFFLKKIDFIFSISPSFEISKKNFAFRKKIQNFEFQNKNFETNPLLFHPTIKHIAASGTRMTLMNY